MSLELVAGELGTAVLGILAGGMTMALLVSLLDYISAAL